jgi:hypothetical protein
LTPIPLKNKSIKYGCHLFEEEEEDRGIEEEEEDRGIEEEEEEAAEGFTRIL